MSKKTIEVLALVVALSGLAVIVYLFFYMEEGLDRNVAITPTVNTLAKKQSTIKTTGKPASEIIKEPTLSKPTGSVDDIVSTVLKDASSEKNFTDQEESDATSTVDDSQELNDLNQIYDSN